jgi:hypothetical protein
MERAGLQSWTTLDTLQSVVDERLVSGERNFVLGDIFEYRSGRDRFGKAPKIFKNRKSGSTNNVIGSKNLHVAMESFVGQQNEEHLECKNSGIQFS